MFSAEELERQFLNSTSSSGSTNSTVASSPTPVAHAPSSNAFVSSNLMNTSDSVGNNHIMNKMTQASNLLNLLNAPQSDQPSNKTHPKVTNLTVPNRDMTPVRRDTPHPSEGVSEAVFNNRSTLHSTPVTKNTYTGNVSVNASPLRKLSSTSPTGALHHISQARSPVKSSLEQISPKDWDYEVSSPSGVPALPMNVIALYTSEPKFQFGKTITTNGSLVIYGLQAGWLRILNCFTGATLLLSSHSRHIADIDFMNDTDRLASTSLDSRLIIWDINRDKLSDLESSKGADAIKLILTQPSHQNHTYFKRVVWDPTGKGMLIALRSDNLLVGLNIPDLIELADDNKEVEFSFNHQGIFMFSAPSEIEINDLCFSRDGEFLVVGDDSGNVRIFSSKTFQQKKTFTSFPGPIHSVNFCYSKLESDTSQYLIVGGENNSEFRMWNLVDSTVPQLVQTIKLIGDDILNHVQVDTSSQYLVAANINANILYILHIEESEEGELSFSKISEFQVKDKIVNFTIETKQSGDVTYIGIFCVTTNEVGLLSISSVDAARNASQGISRFVVTEEAPEVQLPTFGEQVKPHPVRASPTRVEDMYFPSSPRSPSQSPIVKRDLDSFGMDFQKLESSLLSKIGTMLSHERQVMKQELEAERQRLLMEDQKRQQELLKTISEALASDVPEEVTSVVDQQMNKIVVPAINKQMETLSKTLSKKLEDTMKRQMKDSLKDSFNAGLIEVLLPSFEKMVGSMLDQLTRVFENGMEEQLKRPLEKYYKEVNDSAVSKLQSEIRKAFKNTGKVSGKVDKEKSVHQEVLSLIANKEYDNAFARVLSVLDVDFVVWTCKNINVDDIFEQDPVPMSQAVILSLLQQLSFDFSTETELKLDWIQKAALSLNPNDPTIEQHAAPVLRHVQQQLVQAQSQNPQYSKKFKMVTHVIHSLTVGH